MTVPVDRLAAVLADRYRIERELGAGGMATVYLAAELKHDRKVAIKVLKPELAAVLGADRFVQEIKTTAALSHPHILPLFDSGEADGFVYYVMPYIEGETIREKLNRETQFGIEEAVKIATEVADALDYAHRHGVIHRDIKPENILLHDGRPMVMDFGIALAVSAAAGGRMTETGLSLGTPHYMSPEQATADRMITARSDNYSLASVLYEMLTGEPPHMGTSAQQIIMKIIAEPAKPATELRKSIPPNVSAALAKALEKLPADRFENAKAFADALADRRFTLAGGAVLSGAASMPRPWLRDPRTITLGAGTLGALAGLLWVLSVRDAGLAGVTSYDVALPDSAPIHGWYSNQQRFALSPKGDFIVYPTGDTYTGALWYRSLKDASARQIDGTTGALQPTISPDGTRLAYFRAKPGQGWTLMVVPVAGGTPSALGEGLWNANVQWLEDDRIQVIDEGDTRIRWFDPGGGRIEEKPVAWCHLPFPIPGRNQLLCGGARRMYGQLRTIGDTTGELLLRTGVDSTLVYGSEFQLVDGRYLVYLSMHGDLLAAPVDLAALRMGRTVRLVTGIERTAITGAGLFSISGTGTLVYAPGPNQSVGHLVTTDGRTIDTLAVAPDAFHLFAMSPDRKRLAAIVDVLDGMELRLYDLTTGTYTAPGKRPVIRQPVWSPRGDRLLVTVADSVFVLDPERPASPLQRLSAPSPFEAFSWTRDDKVIGWYPAARVSVSLDLGSPSVRWDTLVTGIGGFATASPGGRWLSFSATDGNYWLAPIPPTGQQYQVAQGGDESHWLSDRVLVYGFADDSIKRATIDVSAGRPVFTRSYWMKPPDFVDTAGESYQLTPDGRVLYMRGALIKSSRFLRVVPNWVAQMKRAVDEANR